MSAENDLTRQDSQPSIFKEVVKSYPAYLLTSLIDIVMDQMKEESSEFKKFISIAADAYDSKQLFLNFVKNDPNFEQSVDRENFIRTLNQNEAMLEYMDQYDSGYQFQFVQFFNLVFDLVETSLHRFPYVLFFETINSQQEAMGIESELINFDWQQYYKQCAVICIKEEAQKKGIVHENITVLREYEYNNL